MAKKTKTTTKYDLKRADIVDKLGEIIDSLDNLDLDSTSPNDLREILGEVVGELTQLSDDVTQEAY